MIGLVHPARRRKTAVESVVLVADLDVAVRRHRHNYLELFLVRARDFHPWASADVEQAGYPALRPAMQRLAASVGPEQVARVVAEVLNHPAQVPRGVVHLAGARLGVAKVLGLR